MSRLSLTDSTHDVLMKLSEGNLGALRVLMTWLTQGRTIDPDAEPLMVMVWLDVWNIVGSSIWMLFKDVCGEDLRTFIAVIRAAQLGLGEALLIEAATTGNPAAIDVAQWVAFTEARLPDFQRAVPVEAEG